MANTTNNRMEIFAVIAGLGALKEPCVVEVYSDSAYTVNAFNDHWIDNWQKNGWINSKKQPVENSDLWKLLLQVIRTKKHEITFHKAKGHADNPWNNRCDELATSAIREYRRLNGEKTEEEHPAKVGEEQAGNPDCLIRKAIYMAFLFLDHVGSRKEIEPDRKRRAARESWNCV